HPGAVGRAYNLCSEGEVTQRDLINALTDALGLPRVTRRVPYGLAIRFAWVREALARLAGSPRPPSVTRRAVYLVGPSSACSIARARAELGWSPRVPIQEGVEKAIAWYKTIAGEQMAHVKTPVLSRS